MTRLAGVLAIGWSLFFSMSCVPWLSAVDADFESVGETSNGLLSSNAVFVPDPATAVTYRSFNRTHATFELVSLIEDTAASVAQQYPDTRIVVGDFSSREGGKISEHASHRTGRDVDLAFLMSSSDGRNIDAVPLAEFDRFGVALRGKRAVQFDVARNWAVVAALLSSEKAAVQWIFVSNGIKAKLLEFALNTNVSSELLDRAVRVLHQPTDGMAHNDHFHVRVFCPSGDAGGFCRSNGPSRPWRPQNSVSGLTDEKRLNLSLSGL